MNSLLKSAEIDRLAVANIVQSLKHDQIERIVNRVDTAISKDELADTRMPTPELGVLIYEPVGRGSNR